MRVKYNSSASCLLRLLLTSLWPAAGQQLRRRREGPCPRAPRKGSRGSGRRFRDRASGTARASGGELPPQPRPPVPGAAGAGQASGPGRGLARRQRGRPLGRGCPPCWFGSRTAPLQLQEEAHVQGRSQTVPVAGLMSSFPLHTPSGVFPGLAAWERVCSGNEPNVCLQRSAWPLQDGPRVNAVWSGVDPGEVPTLPAASSPETTRDPLGRNRSGVSCGPQGPSNCVQNKS